MAIKDLGLRGAKDMEIFKAAREANAVVLTKDADFPHLLSQHGPPPRVMWMTCGNTSNARLQAILKDAFPKVLKHLEAGDALVQIAAPAVDGR